MRIYAREWGTELAHVDIEVSDGNCMETVHKCTDIEVFPDYLKCTYLGKGIFGDCNTKQVTLKVKGQEADPKYICYGNKDTDGQITYVPNTRKSIPEGKEYVYEISLTQTVGIVLSSSVTIEVSATCVGAFTDPIPCPPDLGCLLSLDGDQFSDTVSVMFSKSDFPSDGNVPPEPVGDPPMKSITVKGKSNNIDEGGGGCEGMGASAQLCMIEHRVNTSLSDETMHGANVEQFTVDVTNEDVADLKLYVYNAKNKSFDFATKVIGPLCNAEGSNSSYGIALDTEPVFDVVVTPIIEPIEGISKPILLQVIPPTLTFTSSDYTTVQKVTVLSINDDVDNEIIQYRIVHNISTQDLGYGTFVETELRRKIPPSYTMIGHRCTSGAAPSRPNVAAPSRPVVTHESQHRLRISWSHRDAINFEVQWSEQDTFADANSNTTTGTERFVDTKTPLALAVVYVRVRAAEGPWSLVSLPWTVASDCDIVNQYLNTSLTLVKWTCKICPVGASCAGNDVTWSDVKALFGWWRHTVGTAPSNFSECLFPPACMGAPNPEFQGMFENASGYDVSLCALSSGYAQQCEGDGAPRCRLCATCAYGYRRRIMDGMARCDACPKPTENRLKIVGGVVLGLGLLAFLVRINLGSGGKRTTAKMYQIIFLDYLQTSSLVVTMDVPWPELLQFIYSIQGVVSTIGEHLLSPDCELTDVRPADVMYQKQLGYVLLPWATSFGAWVFWRVLCLCRRRGWTSGEPSYQDKYVATVVFLLFLLYPTMCNASFALLSFKEVNGQLFLHADLQEPYMSGRHLLFVLLLSVPQLAFVFGLPIVGYLILRKHHRAKRLHESRVQFRYGMLYNGYQYKCWWWDMVVAYRKATISFVTNYVPSSVEIHVLLFVLTLSLFLNTQWRPYTDEEASDKKQRQSLHNMGAYSMLLVYVTGWSGFYFKESPYCEKDTWSCMALMVVIALLNSCFFVYCVVMLGYAYVGERMPDVAQQWNRMTKRCKRRQPNIVLEEENTSDNPMYRSRRTSSFQSRMASRADVEMAPIFKALGMSKLGRERELLKENKRLRERCNALKANKEMEDAENKRLKAEQKDEVKRMICRAFADFNYEANGDDELSLKEGYEIEVTEIDDDDGWWHGKLDGKYGAFPYNYVHLKVGHGGKEYMVTTEEKELYEIDQSGESNMIGTYDRDTKTFTDLEGKQEVWDDAKLL
eukprot:g7392.t1